MCQNVVNENAGTQCNRSELFWLNKFKIAIMWQKNNVSLTQANKAVATQNKQQGNLMC